MKLKRVGDFYVAAAICAFLKRQVQKSSLPSVLMTERGTWKAPGATSSSHQPKDANE